jgi:hypothetical protein
MKSVGIVGGGFVGLFAAIQFRLLGYDVCLYEARRIGSGASTNNHGILHSGATLRVYHPDTADLLHQNLAVMDKLFSDFYIRDSITYRVPQDMLSTFRAKYTSLGRDKFSCPDRVVDLSRLLNSLYQTCINLGVRIRLNSRITLDANKFLRDRYGLLYQDCILLAAGAGMPHLVGDELRQRIRQRTGFMMHVPGVDLEPTQHLKKGGFAIVPVPDDQGVLFGAFGGRQPFFDDRYRNAIPTSVMRDLFKIAARTAGTREAEQGYIYPCIKTEFESDRTDQYWVQLHPIVEQVKGLANTRVYACLPGKWSLAYHITHKFISHITGTNIPVQDLKDVLAIIKSAPDPQLIELSSWKQAFHFQYPEDHTKRPQRDDIAILSQHPNFDSTEDNAL